MVWYMLVILGLVILYAYITARVDNYKWNDGKCKLCGGKLELFDLDSQGGEGYVCHSGHRVWF